MGESFPIEPYLQHIGDGAAVPVVFQMLGLVNFGDKAGAVEHIAVVAAVAHRTIVDAVRPSALLLLGEGLGVAIVGGVIEGGGEVTIPADIDELGAKLGVQHPHLQLLGRFLGVAKDPLLVIDGLFHRGVEQGGAVVTAKIASGESGSFRVDMGEGCHHIAAAI